VKLGKIIGSVVCTQKVDSLTGERMLLVQPLGDDGAPHGTAIVACDAVQAGPGDTVLYEGGREAAMALRHPFNPADAAVIAIVDAVSREVRPTREVRPAREVRPTRAKGASGTPEARV